VTDRRYPFSTRDGKYIPSNILAPVAFLESVTTISWSGGVDCTNYPLLLIDVENPSGVAFTVDGVTPPSVVVPGEFTPYPAFIMFPPGGGVIIKVPTEFPFIWWIAEGNNTAGYIYLIAVSEWNTLATEEVLTRG